MRTEYKIKTHSSTKRRITEESHWYDQHHIRLVKKNEYEDFENMLKTEEILDA
jgi:hypothetical protein